jgi:glutaconate CoA-transferase, subunit A
VIGTSIVDHNDYVSIIDDPFGGPPVAVARPVKIDVGIIHAMRGDKYGNVQHRGAHFLDHLIAMASDKVVVQVERIVSNEVIRSTALDTTLPCEFVDAVAEAPHGAHPTASQNFYRLDVEFIKVYVKAARAFLAGEPGYYEKVISRFVDEPWTHAEYCEAIGMQRLFGLSLEGSDD